MGSSALVGSSISGRRRLHRQRPCDTPGSCLLAAGEAQRILLQPVLYLVPDGGTPQGALHQLVQLGLAADAVGPGAVGNVVIDAHGEGIGFLKHHADLTAQAAHVRSRRIDIFPPIADLAGDLHPRHQIVHAVQGFQKCGLAAAGGADKGGDAFLRDVHGDAVQRLMSAVPQVQILHLQNRVHCRSLPFQLPPDDPGGEVDEQGQHHEDGGDGEGQRRLPALGGIDVQSHRQGG